jgi:hypothetical protein
MFRLSCASKRSARVAAARRWRSPSATASQSPWLNATQLSASSEIESSSDEPIASPISAARSASRLARGRSSAIGSRQRQVPHARPMSNAPVAKLTSSSPASSSPRSTSSSAVVFHADPVNEPG